MADIESLEQYFDILLEQSVDVDENHQLADDKARYELYDKLRKDFHQISIILHKINLSIKSRHPGYVSITNQLTRTFYEMATISNEEFDYYIRTLAIEKLLQSKRSDNGLTLDMLEKLIERLMALFFEDGEDVMKITRDTLNQIKKETSDQDDEPRLRDYIEETNNIYDSVENDLQEAKTGIMAKDKKMMKILKKIKLGLGQSLVKTAIQKVGNKSNFKKRSSFTSASRDNNQGKGR